MRPISRRGFIRTSGAAAIVFAKPAQISTRGQSAPRGAVMRTVTFGGDGVIFRPEEYAALLVDLTRDGQVAADDYSAGGVIEQLEKRFAGLTGKERALYLPSGTMANQLAIHALSGDKSKVFVQDTSHVFRDEADAAQTVFGKRLIPLAPGRATFTLDELERAVRDVRTGEVFPTGIGAISIESPVRRMQGEIFDIDEMRKIAAFARANGIGLHLDGARVFLASPYSGISVQQYSSLFDTVYVSLYKYFGAGGGAILCGSERLLSTIPHLTKIHGGVMFRNWHNAAVALHMMEGFDERFTQARARSERLFESLTRTGPFQVTHVANGSNIYRMTLSGVDEQRFRARLLERWNIRVPAVREDGTLMLAVNETQLFAPVEYLTGAFDDARRA